MKKIISVILAVIIAASLAACGAGEAVSSAPAAQGGSVPAPSASETPSVELTGEIDGEITVSCYDTMSYKQFLEEAARLFEEKYPGTKVNVETFSAMPEIKTSEQDGKQMVMVQMQDDTQDRADYISKVNTSLMSGEGADVLAMDILPVHKYVDGGQLENLAAYMASDADFNRADYRENILDAVEYQGGTWFLPLDYAFNYYAYDTTLLSGAPEFGTSGVFTAEELIALAEGSFDGTSKLFNIADYTRGPSAMPGGMWGTLLGEHYASFVDLENKKANLGDGSFAQLMESVKGYSEQGYISKGATGQRNPEDMMRRSGEPPTDRTFFKAKNIFNLISHFTRQLGVRMNIMMEGGSMSIEDDDEIAGIAANANGSVPFTYEQAYGINSNSKNKQTAWAFLRFLLGEEMQLNTNLRPTALPINNAAREKKVETVLTGMMGNSGQALNESQLEAVTQYNEAVEEFSKLINTYVFADATVNDMIAAEVSYFFDGTKTADEVAQTLQNKVSLYLNE